MEGFTKITTGWVKQNYEPNKEGIFVCTMQRFVAGDIVEFVDDWHLPVESQEHKYQPYDMVQPKRK